MTKLELDVVKKFIVKIADGDEYNPHEKWRWPANWKPEQKQEFWAAFIEEHPDYGDYNILDNAYVDRSPVAGYMIGDFLLGKLEGEGEKDEDVATSEESQSILKLAAERARQNHELGFEGVHDGYFDECDNPSCKLVNTFYIEEKDGK